MKQYTVRALALLFALLLLCAGGERAWGEKSETPEYSLEESWAYFAVGEDKAADLFLVCPTVDMNEELNMSLEDQETKAAFLGALNMERGIYEDSARMFAPYYRQMAMMAYE
ncbi:MAG: DUF3089 domain-containing protein, partial [Oscillospiraceae bacterium]|nr:DUF3089 domain-containing protein [Oscillospiraceae bacterium]